MDNKKWANFVCEQAMTDEDRAFWENHAKKCEEQEKIESEKRSKREAARLERSQKIKETHKQHDKLVKLGAEWLLKNTPTKGNVACSKCSIVTTELVSYASENPDVLGFANDGRSVLLEAKISREDFKRDFKKIFRKHPEKGMGQFRMYIAPKGLIKTEELPENWGLLEVNEKDKIKVVKHAQRQASDKSSEIIVLASIIKRIGQKPPNGVSIRCYTYETKNNASLLINKEEVQA